MPERRHRCYVAKTLFLPMSKNNSTPHENRHEDDPNFRRSNPGYDEQRATAAHGHDDQGGSRQSEGRDYDERERREGKPAAGPGNQNLDTRGTHSDARYTRERFGGQSDTQRHESVRQQQTENLGGQDSRDQSTGDRHSLLGRASGEKASDEREVGRQHRRSAGAVEPGEPEPYASDTRDNLSRQYAEHRRGQEEKGKTAGADYDGNWTRDTDKPPQPGPARGGAS